MSPDKLTTSTSREQLRHGAQEVPAILSLNARLKLRSRYQAIALEIDALIRMLDDSDKDIPFDGMQRIVNRHLELLESYYDIFDGGIRDYQVSGKR